MSRLDPRPDPVGEDLPHPFAGGDSSPGRSPISESAEGARPAPPPTSQVLRTLKTCGDLLRARGLAIPPLDLTRAYARHLAARTLTLSAAPEGETGFDARDSWGVRYRIMGHRNGMKPAHVQVPGIPDRCFDRIVLVEFGAGFGVTRAAMAPDEPFLRSAEYRESDNIWTLPLDHDFWTGSEAEDLTLVLRATAAQIEQGETPFTESMSTPRFYRTRPRDSELSSGARRKSQNSRTLNPDVSN